MTHPNIEPFDPTTGCHPNPGLGGADGCPHIQPCELRCHIRWLDGQVQANDWIADRRRGEWLADLGQPSTGDAS